MSRYGLKIKPESFHDGSNIVFSDATVINFLGDYEVRNHYAAWQDNNWAGYWFDVNNKSPNSRLLVVPLISGGVSRWMAYRNSTEFDYIDLFAVIDNISVSGNIVTVNFKRESAHVLVDNGYGVVIGKVRVFEIFDIDQSALGRYGLKIKKTFDFTKVIDYSKVGLIVYKNKHRVSSTLNLADVIPNKSSYLVYADWNHPSAVVEFDYDTHTLIVNSGEIDIDIIIVNSNINIAPPSRYGMIIRSSKTGKITFSSRYAAVPLNTLIPFSNGTGIQPFKKSYVAISRYGICTTPINKGQCYVHHSGLIKNGSIIRTGKGTSFSFAHRVTASVDVVVNPNTVLLVIDGSVFSN